MNISTEKKDTSTTLLLGLVVAVFLGVFFHLVGYLLPTALTHLAPKMSLNLNMGALELFQPMLLGALTIVLGLIACVLLPACVIVLVKSSLYKLGVLGQWMVRKT